MDALSELNKSGLSKKLGKSRNYVVTSLALNTIQGRLNVVSSLKRTATEMLEFKFKNEKHFEEFCERHQLFEATFARHLGISAQAFNQAKHRGFSEERIRQIEEIMVRFGQEFKRSAERLFLEI